MDYIFLLEILLFIMALSMDTFFVGISYGISQIKVTFYSIIIINLVCSIIFAFSLFLGSFLFFIFPNNIIKLLGFSLLFLLGVFKLCDYGVKKWIYKKSSSKIEFHAFHILFIIQVYGDSTKADLDASKTLSWKEAVILALTLSIDSFTAGIGAGIIYTNHLLLVCFSFLFGICIFVFGNTLGKYLAKYFSHDLNWISGVLLILLAVLKL